MKLIRLLIITFSYLVSTVCLADNIALAPMGGVSGSDTRPFMIGWKFSTTAPLTLSGLAYLDATGAGLKESHQVGIFDATSGAVLISASVPAGPATKYTNGFRVAPVSYTLPAGTYVIGGQRLTDLDSPIDQATSVVAMPQVHYIEQRETQTSSFSMPATNFSLDESGSFGPSFTVASAPTDPAVTSISNSASFQTSFAGNTYVSIYGANLSTTTRTWQTQDFAGGNRLPLSLDGVSATVNNVPAYIEFVSPAQINLITPNIASNGPGVQVVLTTAGNAKVTAWMNVTATAPAFFTWITTTPDSGKYLVAQHAANFTDVGKAGLFPNQPATFTTPAKPGETIVLYGTGFGPTTPVIAQGIITDTVYPLNPVPTATIGGINAQVTFAGLIPSLSQVYQFNIVVPPSAPDGDLQVIVNVSGVTSFPGLITVSH